MTTLIDRLRGLLIHFGGDNNIRTMNDAIEAVAERDKLHADIETLRLDLDVMRGQSEGRLADLRRMSENFQRALKHENAQTMHADEMRLAAARAMTERDEARKQWENNAAALVSVHKELKAAKDRVREQEFAIACRSAARVDTAEPGTDTTVIWKQAPPSPLNLVERVLRLERAVLFVRQRPDTRNDIKARRP